MGVGGKGGRVRVLVLGGMKGNRGRDGLKGGC
jgi:hypothetical protein